MSNNIAKIGDELHQLIKAVLEDFSKGHIFIDNITNLRREVRDRR